MKRSVGAFASCASSTSRMMRAMVLSSGSRVTRSRSAASALMDPANTGSPGPLTLGIDSPVTGLSSMPDIPSAISPSAGMRSPGRTRTIWPIERLSAGTSRTVSPSTRRAVFGTRLARARIPARARSAATPSRTSPIAKRKMTIAASAAAPMNKAPPAAMVINISIVNGIPERKAAKARLATGTRPIKQAATNGHSAIDAGRS